MAFKSFVLYDSYKEQIDLLDMQARGELLTAIFCFRADEDLPPMSTAAKVVFVQIKAQLERDEAKYLEECERKAKNGEIGKQYGYLGAEFGKFGGRPRKSYDEIIDEYGLSDIVKKKVQAYIKSMSANGILLKNEQLRMLLLTVSKKATDKEKIECIYNATINIRKTP